MRKPETHRQGLIQQFSPHIRTRQMQHDLHLILLAILLDQLYNLLCQLETLACGGTPGAPGDVDTDGRGERVRDETVDPVEEVGETLRCSRREELEGVEGVCGSDELCEFGHVGVGMRSGGRGIDYRMANY